MVHSPEPEPAIETYATDRLLVKPRLGVNRQALDRLHDVNRCALLRNFPDFGGLQVLRVPPGHTVADLVRRYQASGLVEYAEPDYRVKLASSVLPNDPKFLDGTLWGLNNAGQNGGLANADIDAPEAWSAWTAASNVIVAVIDSGIRPTHEDLAGNLWTNPLDGSHGFNTITGTTNVYDENGHGTRVAGIIGARGNNGLGVAGVAWQVRIMACKFVDQSGGTISDAITCLDFARTNGAQVINASWGLDEFSLSLSNAMVALRAAGILVVAAAGNNVQDIDVFPHYPAGFELDNIISVMATTRQDEPYYLSNFGATNVDLAAPGAAIYSTDSLSDSSYASDEGTSMAAAYVSGAAALLRAAHPADSPAQIIDHLLTAVDLLPALTGSCVSGGRLNLRKALGVPVSAPVLRAVAAAPGNPFVMLLSGDPGRTYVVEASLNLGNWSPVSTNLTGLTGALFVTNNPATNAWQFYRARFKP